MANKPGQIGLRDAPACKNSNDWTGQFTQVVKSGLEAQSMACARVHLQLQAHAMSRGQAKQEVSEPVSDGDDHEDDHEKGEGDLDHDSGLRTNQLGSK